jgi:hypothetical protein
MGGIIPLDCQNHFYKLMGITDNDYLDDKTHLEGTNKKLVEEHLAILFEEAAKANHNKTIMYQVLAKIILQVGAKITEYQRVILLTECAETAIGNRAKYIVELIEKIISHEEDKISLLTPDPLINKILTFLNP